VPAAGTNLAVDPQEEANLELVLEYLDEFGTFDPERYDPYLAEEPTYMAGMNIRKGRDAFHANTDAGRILYPRPEEATREILATTATGDWVSILLIRRAPTNKVEDYENLYALFFEVVDGKIHTQVEMLDFRVSAEQFDLSALEAT
jgi:ketosteroid isomerase-like protein